jgi:predicted Rossmann fold nucleotide-binding protein DprA/Smf involved in DNA uptake
VRSGRDVIEALEMPRRGRAMAEGGEEFRFDADAFADDTLRDDFAALADFDMEEDAEDGDLVETLMGLIGASPVEIDELARAAGARPSEIALALLELDIAGRVDMLPGGLVARRAAD